MQWVPPFTMSDYYGRLWLVEPGAFEGYRVTIENYLAKHLDSLQPSNSNSLTQMNNGVAVIPLIGLLTKGRSYFSTSTIQARADIRAAASNPNVKGIVLAIDSPGGTADGIMDLGTDIKAARRAKPVIAHIDGLGASAAYWAASQASAIYANNSMAEVGSIGVMASVVDISKALDQAGIKVHLFKTGPLKGTGALGVPVTEEQQAHVQGLVDAAFEEFRSVVKSGRHLSDAALGKVTTGGVFPARQAIDLKLIDGIQPLEQTIRELSKSKPS